MSNELIGILGVGVALLGVGVTMAGLLVSSLRGVEKRLGTRIDSVERRMDSVESKLVGRLDAFDSRMTVVERGLAKLEGLMEGIRDAVFERRRSAKS